MNEEKGIFGERTEKLTEYVGHAAGYAVYLDELGDAYVLDIDAETAEEIGIVPFDSLNRVQTLCRSERETIQKMLREMEAGQ
jgi:hypothetical protein